MNLADALSGRAGARGVRWVLRDGPQRGILRQALAGLLLQGTALGPCRLRRAKFRPGRKLAAYYDVQVVSPRGAHSTRAVAVTWQAGAEPDLAAAAPELTLEARAGHLAAPFAELQAAVRESCLQILVSPLDPRFPQLFRVSDPRHVREMLGGGGATAQAGMRGGYRVSAVRYRPGQRHVLRYDPIGHAEGGDRGPGTVFAKLHRNGDAGPAFEHAMAIADWLGTCGSPVRAAAPLGHIGADDVVLYAEVPGIPLSACIARQRRDLARELRCAGAALRLLQGAPAALGRKLPRHRFDVEIQAIARTSQHVQALLPGAGAMLRAILDRALEIHERVPKEPAAIAHGDYKADHLFVHPDQLALIDFEAGAMADPALDVGKFLADLDWWFSVSRRGGLRAAKRAFLDGYGPSLASHRMHRARLYEVLVLSKITAHRVPVFSPTWGRDTSRLIRVADALIGRLAADLKRGA